MREALTGAKKIVRRLTCLERLSGDGATSANSAPTTIIATDIDIDAGFRLYKEIETSNEIGLSPYVYQIFVDAIAPLLFIDGIDKGVKREEIVKKYYEVRHKILSPQTLKRDIIPQLEIVGLIRQEPDPDNKSRLLVHSSSAAVVSTTMRTFFSNNNSKKKGEGEEREVPNTVG
jgi:hypothetical protein